MMKYRLLLLPLVSLLLGSYGAQAQVTFTKAPSTNQLYPRHLATNKGTVEIAGVVDDAGIQSLVLRHYVDNVLVDQQNVAIGAGRTFAYSVDITAALEAHRFELSGIKGGSGTVVLDARDVVAGDVFIIQGQSNAQAARWADSAAGDQSPWIRSYGTTDPNDANDPGWGIGVADLNTSFPVGDWAVGQLGTSFGKNLVDNLNTRIPVALLSGAQGNRPIAHFQKDAPAPAPGLPNNYLRLLERAKRAGVKDKIRGILWYQGEANGTNGVTPLAGQQYITAFQKLKQFWEADYPGLEKIYVYQIRNGCDAPSVDLRDGMRRLGDLFDKVEVMSTTGLSGHFEDSPGVFCHWEYANGYRELGKRVFDLVNRDLYDSSVTEGITPPSPLEAYFSRANRKEVTVVMRSSEDLIYQSGVHQDFFVYNPAAAEFNPVAPIDGSASGNRIVLKFTNEVPSTYRVGYADKPRAATLQRWVTNMNGVGLVTFTSAIDTRDDLPPDPPELIAPMNGAGDLSSPVALDWAESNLATGYDVDVATGADFANTVLTASTSTTEQLFSPPASGAYFWRVRANNLNGISDWSPTWSFSVLFPPGLPTLIQPANGASDLQSDLTLQWLAGRDAYSHDVQVGSSPTFPEEPTFGAVQTNSLQIGPLATGQYFWRVRSRNTSGVSAWSQTFSFSVLARPIAPALVYPEDGAWNLPTSFSLRWNALSEAVTYDIEVATVEGFEELLLSREGVTEAQTAIGPLVPGDYFWRVRARNSSGIGDWSSPFGFSIVTAPEAATLIDPENGQVGTVSEPTLTWDPVTFAGSYQIQVSRNESFSSIAITALDLPATQVQVGPLELATTYYWRVQARNLVGVSPWSQTFQFTVQQHTSLERDDTERPDRFALHPAYPNPFNPSTRVSFSLPDLSPVRLTVHDLHGRLVDVLVSQQMAAGTYRTLWNAAGESSGVYLVRLEAGAFVSTQKVVLLK